MNTRQVASEYRLAYWAKIMNDRKKSGLSVKAFCESAGYRESSYFYWQKKLRETTCQELIIPQGHPKTPSGWLLYGSSDKPDKGTLRIEIKQCLVSVTGDSDMDLLSKVCRVLVAL
jgi:hypothetical protein